MPEVIITVAEDPKDDTRFTGSVAPDPVIIKRARGDNVTWKMASDATSQQFKFKVRKKAGNSWPTKDAQQIYGREHKGGRAKTKALAKHQYHYEVRLKGPSGKWKIDPVMEIDDGV